jgi:hypothetical protein
MPAVHVMPIPADEDATSNAPDAPAAGDVPDTVDADGSIDGDGSVDGQSGPDAEDHPDDAEAATQPTPLSADDTSTTAINIVDAKAP